MSIIDNLITDRTQADAAELKALYAKAEWTAEEWNEFLLARHKGAYNASDMNRVMDALDYLAERVTEFGFRKPVIQRPRAAYSIGDFPSESELAVYLSNVATIRSVLDVPKSVPAVPEDISRRITVTEANNIERILAAVEDLLRRIPLAWMYAGEIYSGEV